MSEDLSSVIKKIISNPEFAGMVSEIKGGSPQNTEAVSEEMMKKLPDVMNMVSSMFGGGGETRNQETEDDATPVITSVKKPGGGYDKVRAEKLLVALKPYLHNGRGDIIDRCISVMQISDVARAIGGLDGIADVLKKGGG